MLKIERGNGAPELFLYGEIQRKAWYNDLGEVVSAEEVLAALQDLQAEKQIVVRLNGPGGDVFEGVAIYQALSRFAGDVRIEVDALAASAMSLVAMAGDTIVVAGNAMLMVHRAWTMVAGNALELAAAAETLRKVDESLLETYATRVGSKATRDQIAAWLDAETWMTAQEAVDRGFADKVGGLKQGAQGSVKPGRFKNCPQSLLATPPQRPAPAAPASHSQIPTIAAKVAALRKRLGR
jgi:ATP-dependent protease ClpP protease subunit